MSRDVAVERHGAVLVVAIDRPSRRNAVNQSVALAVAAAMDTLDADPSLRVGIITGRGGCFCAGMDLIAFLDGERPEIEGRGFAGVTETPPRKPLIAAVEGFALGFWPAISSSPQRMQALACRKSPAGSSLAPADWCDFPDVYRPQSRWSTPSRASAWMHARHTAGVW